MTAFFATVDEKDYALNRAIDEKLRQLTWDDMAHLFDRAGLRRASHWVTVARQTVREAQQRWPDILAQGPDAVRASVTDRLNGGIRLAQS